MQGKIVKGIAGFYYVHTAENNIYECKAKGVFRKDGRKPLVGDDVELEVLDEEKLLGNIRELLPRTSELIRPAVANVDQALVIFSIVKPQPNLNLLDRFLIMMEQQGIPCIICFNKLDIDEEGAGQRYEEIYRSCGYQTIQVSAKIWSAGKQSGETADKGNIQNTSGGSMERLMTLLQGKTTTVAGPSGVGKSSLINCLQQNRVMETGGISTKIERGKHTTRHSELIAISEDTYILDTPGFSSLSLFDMDKEELAGFFPEFVREEQYCKFAGCSHIHEPVCGIRDAVAEERISKERYENYCLLYEELKNVNPYKGKNFSSEKEGKRR
ncbi:MAG: ribosome small subunit-dependent GTPase A [Lachnospiraceae bacterium]|nr:ribosome small subunit-dependent GTPase A [Lachnospiraceae bacterium]